MHMLRLILFYFLLLPICRIAAEPSSAEGDVSIAVEEASTTERADRAESGANAATDHTAQAFPPLLTCLESVEDLRGQQGDVLLIPFEVSERATRIHLHLSGGTGDADLYLRHEAPPTLRSFDYRPLVEGNEEEIFVDNPESGTWYAMIYGKRDFSGVTLTLNCVFPLGEEERPEFEGDPNLELAIWYELNEGFSPRETIDEVQQARLLNRRGREAFNAGRFDEALEIWMQWAEQDSENPRPVALVGDLYLRSGDLDRAIEYYRRSLAMQPGQLVLMTRLARILDKDAGRPDEALELVNRFNRLFPDSSSVTLTQAEWLIRRNRFNESLELIQTIIDREPDNLSARSLLHPLLRGRLERYENMRRILEIGQKAGLEISLGQAVHEHALLTRPESWVLMNFLDEMSGTIDSHEGREIFSSLLPREDISRENFQIGRMSTNWISSREEVWEEGGSLILSADPGQTEAFLRLDRSDAMHNGFVEAEIDDSRGYFWIYARRGEGNMIRFGFDEDAQLYMQVWVNENLVSNHSRIWSREAGSAVLRLEVRGDGAMGYINGEPAFSSPITVPSEMGLGWWGIAPWSAQFGTAKVSVSQVAGGPLPVRLGILAAPSLGRRVTNDAEVQESSAIAEQMKAVSGHLSSLAPEWFVQNRNGDLVRQHFTSDMELRLLARYHRLRLLPMVRLRSHNSLDWSRLAEQAKAERVDGFTLIVDRIPGQQWMREAEEASVDHDLTLHVLTLDPRQTMVSFRELSGTMGLFAGPRRVQNYPLMPVSDTLKMEPSEENPDQVWYWESLEARP